MTYEIVTRNYDRTPEGNIPFYREIDFDSDLAAMAYAASEGSMDDKEIRKATPEKLREMITEEIGIEDPTVESLASLLEDYDPSDFFTFYVKNLDTNNYLFLNEEEDVKDWESDWGDDEDDDEDDEDEEFDEGDYDEYVEHVASNFPPEERELAEWLADIVAEYKQEEDGWDECYQTYIEYFEDDLEDLYDAGDDSMFRFLSCYVLRGLDCAFDFECHTRKEAMDMMEECKKIAPNLDEDYWVETMDEANFEDEED